MLSAAVCLGGQVPQHPLTMRERPRRDLPRRPVENALLRLGRPGMLSDVPREIHDLVGGAEARQRVRHIPEGMAGL